MNEALSNKEIIQNIVAALKITVKQFALGMGISYSRVFDLYSGRTVKAGADVVDAIVKTYGINERYAKLGLGPMFADVPSQVVEEKKVEPVETKVDAKEPQFPKTEESAPDDVVIDPMAKIIVSLSRQVREKDTYIRKLEDLLKANNIEF